MYKLSLILVICMIINSCNFNKQFINDTKDKEDALVITNRFYNHIQLQEFDSIADLFSKSFYKNTSREKLQRILNKTYDKLGKLKFIELDQWKTRVIIGSNPSSEYFLIFKNSYDLYPAEEQIWLKRETDSVIRIVSYNINSDGFFD